MPEFSGKNEDKQGRKGLLIDDHQRIGSLARQLPLTILPRCRVLLARFGGSFLENNNANKQAILRITGSFTEYDINRRHR
jgi:hypothetical protein